MDPEKLYPLATGAMRKKIEAAMHENPAHSGFVVEHVSWKRWGREFLESLEILLSQGSPNILDEKIRLVSDRRGPIVLANYQAARDLGRRAGGAGVTIANAHKDAPRVRVNLDIFAAKPRAEVRTTDVRRKAGSALLTGLVTPLAAFAGMYRSGDDDFLSYFMNEHPVGFWIWTALMVFTLANLVRTNKHLSMNRYRRSISRVNPSRRQQILDGILRQMQFYLKRISAVEENIRARQAAVAMIKTWQAEEESGNEKHMRISPVDPEVFAAKERELRSMLERFPIKRFRELFLKAAMAATDSGSQDLIEVFRKYRYFMKIRNAFAPAKGVRSAVHYSFSPGPEAAEHLSPQSDDPEDDPEFERLLRATLSREELNERLGKVSGVDEAVAEARAQEDFDAVILEAFGDVRFEDAGARLAMVSFLGSLAQDRLENPVYVRQAAVTALRKIGGSDSLALANQAMEDPDMLSREVRLPAKCSRREAIEKIVEGMTWVLGTEAVREQYSGVQKRIRRLFRENPGMLGFLKKYPLRLFSIQDKPKIDSIILGDFRRYWFNVVGLIHFQFEIDGDRSIPHEVKRTMEVRSRETPIDMGLAVEIFKNQFLLSGVVHHEYLHYTGILSEGVVLLKQINFMKGLIVRKTLFMLEKNREAAERELALAMGEMGILPLANYFADSADDKYLAGLNADILRLYGPDHMSADQVEEESARIIDSISRYIEQRNSELSAERLLDPGKTLYEPLSDRDKDRIRRLVKETRSIRNTLTLDEFRSIKDKSFASTVWDAYLAQGGGRIFSEIAAFLKVVSSGTSDRLGARSENRFGDEFVSGGKVRESRPAGETSYDADGERLESLLRRARSDRDVIGNEIGMLERDPAKLRNPRSNESRRLAILEKQEAEAQDRVTRYERQLADHKSRPELRLLMGDEGAFFSNLIDPSQIVLDNRSIVPQGAQAARAGSQVAPKETRAELRMTANAPVRKRVRKTVKETEEPLPVVDRFAVANGLGMELKLLREERLSDRTLAAVAHGGVLALDATSAEILQSVREVQAALNLTGISDALKAFSAAASSDPGLLLAPSDAKGGLVVPVSGLPEIGQIARDVFAMIVNTEVRKAYVAEGISADTARSVLASFAHVRDLKGNPVLGRLEIVPAAKGDMIRAVTGAGAALAYRLGMKPCDVLVLLEGARYAAIREKIAETALVSDLGERADLAPARDYLAMGAAMLNVRLDNDAWTLLNQRVADALRKKDGFFEMDRNALAGLAAILTQIFAQERATATAA